MVDSRGAFPERGKGLGIRLKFAQFLIIGPVIKKEEKRILIKNTNSEFGSNLRRIKSSQ